MQIAAHTGHIRTRLKLDQQAINAIVLPQAALQIAIHDQAGLPQPDRIDRAQDRPHRFKCLQAARRLDCDRFAGRHVVSEGCKT